MNALTRILHNEHNAEGLRVNSVCPGWVQTDMGGAAANLTVEESARMLTDTMLGLTPDQSGAFLDVDGTPFTP